MARTVAQAEAELRVAALDYAEAYAAYSAAFERNNDFGGYYKADGVRTKPLHPETEELVSISSQKQNAMEQAAHNLREAVRAELRAEAL